MASSYQAYGNSTTRDTLPYSNLRQNSLPLGQSYPPPLGLNQPQNFSTTSFERDSQDDQSPFSNKNAYGGKGGGIKKDGDIVVDLREISRTPSPTPSEEAALARTSVIDWKALSNWRFWFRKEWIWYYIIGIIVTVCVILFTVYHKQIVNFLQPAANYIHDLPVGWLIPIAIFFVISFPPLFGHEILAILCGLVWGLWVGFGIVAAGTFLGELGNFYAFKYCCSARGEKLEKNDISYGCLARVVREGGFKIALIARYSAIPGHFTTAVFSTCGMSVWTFSIAAILSLPKQFITVYLGVALEQSETGQTSRTDTIIKDSVLAVTVVVTIAAMWYIYHLMNKVKPAVIYDRRKARQVKLNRPSPYGNSSVLDSTTSVTFNPNESETTLPLTATFPPPAEGAYQQWDSQGRAVGYSGDPSLHSPRPQRPAQKFQPNLPPSRTTTVGSIAPAMSEYNGRQNSVQSTGSWDVPQQGRQGDIYKMTARVASPPRNPFADPSTTGQYNIAPPPQPPAFLRPGAQSSSSVPNTPTAPGPTSSNIPGVPFMTPVHSTHPPYPQTQSQQPTPTQAHFPPQQPPPRPQQQQQVVHGQEGSDSTFYTASPDHTGHSRNGTLAEDAYTGYEDSRLDRSGLDHEYV
ncbi:Golgi apparatus membrane protein TVP38 [Abortiporus biennis]